MHVRGLLVGLVTMCALPVGALGAVSEEELGRVLSGLYDSVSGATTADVNADGLATAADVPGVLSGRRNPTWRGPRRVGVTQIVFTKDSETTGQPRPLDTWIWYPTDADGTSNPQEMGIRDASVATDGGPFPLIMFSHGSCGVPNQSPFYMAQLASYGFVVASPPHPGNLTTDGLSACRTAGALGDSFMNRVADIRFVLDSMIELSGDNTSMFFDRIDASRIGMSGHSFGGQTTFRVAAAEERILAAVPLAPAGFGIDDDLDMLAADPLPIQIQGAADDRTTRFEPNQQGPFDQLSPPRSLLKILTVSDRFRMGVPGSVDPHLLFAQACGTTLCAEQLQILRYATPFFLLHVADDNQFADFLAPSAMPAGVEYTLDE